jgi:NAD(P)H dehydrogenase (quinone)
MTYFHRKFRFSRLSPTPRLLPPSDIAEILDDVLGRKVAYKDSSFKMIQKAAIAQGFPLSQIAHVRHYAEEVRNGTYAVAAPTNHVFEVSGVEPEDFETTAGRYIQNPELINPGLKIGSKLAAVGFLLRMMATRPVDLAAWEQERSYPLLTNPELAHENAEWRRAAESFDTGIRPPGVPAGIPARIPADIAEKLSAHTRRLQTGAFAANA